MHKGKYMYICIYYVYYVTSLTPSTRRESLAATVLNPELEPWQGMLIEVWLTFFLVCVILGATNQKRKGNLFMPTIVIGFAVAVGVMSGVLTNHIHVTQICLCRFMRSFCP